jgi:hypothetical protein
MRRALLILLGASAAVGLLWLVFVARSSTELVTAYRVTGPATIVVETSGPPRGWTRVTHVDESRSDVTVTVESWNWLPGPGTAYALRVELPVSLGAPLGDRAVIDASGYRVPRQDASPPS